jgi:hypothetical protein
MTTTNERTFFLSCGTGGEKKGSGVHDASSATDAVKVKFFGRDGLGYGECHRQKDSALKKSFMRKTLLFNSPDVT